MTTQTLKLLIPLTTAALLCACGGGDTSNASIGGTVSGLGSGLSLALQNNGSDTLNISANGSFEFATQIAPGNPYDVTVLTQPAGQTCTVSNGSGTINQVGDHVGDVVVSCAVTSSVAGTVSGLNSGTSVTLALTNNGTTTLLPIAVNGAFSFPGILQTGTTYTVAVATSPAGETCTLGNASGTVADNVTAQVTVVCS